MKEDILACMLLSPRVTEDILAYMLLSPRVTEDILSRVFMSPRVTERVELHVACHLASLPILLSAHVSSLMLITRPVSCHVFINIHHVIYTHHAYS